MIVKLIRKRHIVTKLLQCGATTESTAKSLEDAGIGNPDVLPRFTEHLVQKKILGKTCDGRYYVIFDKQRENTQ